MALEVRSGRDAQTAPGTATPASGQSSVPGDLQREQRGEAGGDWRASARPSAHTAPRLSRTESCKHRAASREPRCARDASGRQVLHRDNRNSCLGVGGEDADHDVVLTVEHHPRLGEHHASWQTSGTQVLGRAETIQPEILLQPDLAEKSASQAAKGLIRHLGYTGSNATTDTTGSLRLAPTPSMTGMADKADVSSSLLRTP